ncbi:fasciclin domain-containing protein [Phthorimaea operculella]|nr:fasciclin domain-containing protein [Phthorimaea operculella]
MRGVCVLLLLAHAANAITGPRPDNDFDRRRQVPLGHPGFNEHQTRFGLNSPLQSFQSQPSLLNNPTPSTVQFQQSILQQQPYVPQFNGIFPAQTLQSNNLHNNINNLQNLPLNNNFQFSQPALQNSFAQNYRANVQPTQSILPQTVPTLASFQNNAPIVPSPQFNPNPTVHIGNQRPTQPSFLPTIPSTQAISHQTQTFNSPNPITIQPAPNLAPQNPHLNFNQQQQIPFQQNVGHQNPLFTNGQVNPTNQLSFPTLEQQSKENLEKLKELQERQRIIQKHQEFVQKQQQKQQEKVKELHEEFLSKQATKTIPTYSTTESYEEYFRQQQEKRRPIQAHETDLFRKAVEMQPPQDKKKQQLYSEIKNLLEESETKGFDDSLRAKSIALLQKPDILKQLKVALAENPEDFNEKNFTSREINLNGQKFEVIRTTNPNLIPKGAITADSSNLARIMAGLAAEPQAKESRINFDDLTKGVLPPGADFELIKQSENGKLEEISKITPTLQNKKKVTFVFLEEQDDGSYKVKGVKANGQQTEEGPEVESILKKIKNGEIQLPGPTKISNSLFSSTTASPTTDATDYVAESSHHPSSYSTFVTTSNHGTTGHTNPIYHTTPTPNTYRSSVVSRTSAPQTQTVTPSTRSVVTSTERFLAQSTASPAYTTSRNNPFPSSTIINTTPYYSRPTPQDLVVIGSSTIPPSIDTSNSQYNFGQPRPTNPSLIDILKENGLFATAKYLKQSGLDTILNETGPYTIFAPTDKAFRTLLVQLGGPDRAEEKFRDNPRLLSGLLLHHVIPGAFDIGSLQDEMTGVSLAGTQLRVNQYDMHDVEWNEVRVTTINGARVIEDKKDIHIPQGIAHAVDRVMFPLPVGDLVQTLQADRDRRFTTFLKAIYASGFAETLAESKTYTIFAPTDAAFARLPPNELNRYTDKAAAKALVARHVLPGTLYSAGMRYYQLRNSMEDAKPLTLQKNAGRIKVNNAQVVTHNIPATNGVIHAIDNIL